MEQRKSYDKILKYSVTAKCTEPLHIGSASGAKEEVLVHPVDDIPFIQATSIAGVFRGYYEQTYGEEKAAELFGHRRFKEKTSNKNTEKDSEHESKIRFTDGKFLNNEKLVFELRPRVSINKQMGTCEKSSDEKTKRESGHKFNMEYISAGAEFTFCIYLYGADEQEKEEVEDIFSALNNEVLQFGGQKSNGCGYFKIEKLLYREFNMKNLKDREQWADEDILSEREYKNLTDVLSNASHLRNAYTIKVNACTEGVLLVKSIAVSDIGTGKEAPDCENIKNGNGDYIVPGSSFKGAVRAQMERIASYLDCFELIDDAFGQKSNEKVQGSVGNLYFFDSIVGKQKVNEQMPIAHRIHIDKFTGGVIHGGLFSEKNVAGDMTIRIVIKNNKSTDISDKVCGLLIMALRDLAIGAMSVGGGYSVGKGILSVKKIIIEKNSNPKSRSEIDFSQKKIFDETGIIKACLTSVQKG